MSIYNNCSFVGRVTAKPELKQHNGKDYCSFSMALKRDYKDSSGEYGADFISCIVWGGRAKFMANWVTPQDIIGVEATAVSGVRDVGGTNVSTISFNVSSITKISGSAQQLQNQETEQPPTSTVGDDTPF